MHPTHLLAAVLVKNAAAHASSEDDSPGLISSAISGAGTGGLVGLGVGGVGGGLAGSNAARTRPDVFPQPGLPIAAGGAAGAGIGGLVGAGVGGAVGVLAHLLRRRSSKVSK